MLSLAGKTSHRFNGYSPPARICGETDYRDLAHQSRLGTIVNSSVGGNSHMPSGYEPAIQLVLPYFGAFSYSIGRQSWLVDPSQILLIQPGWEFVDGQPVEGLGHASLLVNPARSIAEEILGSSLSARAGASAFGATRSPPNLWLLTHYFLAGCDGGLTPLQADEWLLRVMQLAAERPQPGGRPATRVVARAREYLHAHGFERVPLDQIARAVGVSPVYLSNEFARSEGVPLYQYQLNLRLARSLHILRDCDDITQLALELGFSSHSHFSATFRRTFGLSPSRYRSNMRSCRPPFPVVGRAERIARASGMAGAIGAAA